MQRTPDVTDGYYILEGNNQVQVEFINNYWYFLQFDKSRRIYCTKEQNRATNKQLEKYEIGYWDTTDPEHPNNQRPLVRTGRFPIPEERDPAKRTFGLGRTSSGTFRAPSDSSSEPTPTPSTSGQTEIFSDTPEQATMNPEQIVTDQEEAPPQQTAPPVVKNTSGKALE